MNGYFLNVQKKVNILRMFQHALKHTIGNYFTQSKLALIL